ncbi:MAG TPA: alpha/beta fold hydrolase, partial [bacterium]
MKPTKKKSIFLKVFWVISAVLLAGGLYFIYVYVPSKVALGILAKTSVHKSLTRTPMESGLAYQDVTFPTKDGITLSGWWIPALGKKKAFGTVLLSHGFTKNREQVLDRAEFLVKSGYQVLLFDHRGHGLSGNSPISGGVLESRDYPAAVQFLKGKGRLQRPVVFFGFSLG